MDFAPYQDANPETARALSPPPRRSPSFPGPRTPKPAVAAPPPGAGIRHADAGIDDNDDDGADVEAGFAEPPRTRLDEFATSLPLRMDVEAAVAYCLLPPAAGVFLLLVEQKSDYVRFHAWQSSLLFSALFVLHLLVAWSAWLSWVLLVADVGLMVYLAFRAYADAETLDRCEVPFFGPLASKILDDE